MHIVLDVTLIWAVEAVKAVAWTKEGGKLPIAMTFEGPCGQGIDPPFGGTYTVSDMTKTGGESMEWFTIDPEKHEIRLDSGEVYDIAEHYNDGHIATLRAPQPAINLTRLVSG